MKQPKKKYAKNVHYFLIKVVYPVTGKVVVSRVPARVVHATKPVKIELIPDHVRKSIKLNGVGDTSKCSMAVCTVTHAGAFPHPVEGHIDWQYARCFVVSKVDYMGLPTECYAYDHDHHEIAKMNDSRGGQARLLKKLIKDGPITITLSPIRIRSKVGRNGGTPPRVPSGARSKRLGLKGAKLRYYTVDLGSKPSQEMMANVAKQTSPKKKGRPSQYTTTNELITLALKEAAALRKP